MRVWARVARVARASQRIFALLIAFFPFDLDYNCRWYLTEIFRYNKLSRTIRELAKRISEIDATEPFRTEMSAAILEKLYILGLIPTKWDLNNAVNISASSFCRRRLPVVMVRSEYSLCRRILIAFDLNTR